MKKALVLVCALILLFSSCAGESGAAPTEADQNTVLYTQISDTVSEKKVDALTESDVSLTEFCEALRISRYKTVNGEPYVVVKTKKALYLVTFSADGVFESKRKIVFSENDGAAFADALQTGVTTLSEVQAMEPDGAYDFLYAGWTEFPRYSFHFFESGDCYNLWFEDDVLSEIIHFTI